jgi:glutathione S-transferase
MSLMLVIGNKNYSSWSFRPWFAMKVAGIPFQETVISLYVPGSREKVLAASPSGKVPALVDGDVHVWDSLAIMEYLNEKFPDRKLWPEGVAARAHARSVSAEMHSGFAGLRNDLTMNFRRKPGVVRRTEGALADIARIQQSWEECRARHGKAGPYLFGAFSIADAMYAPVVSRFLTYDVKVSAPVRAYMDAIAALPAWREWAEAAAKEEWVLEKFEY